MDKQKEIEHIEKGIEMIWAAYADIFGHKLVMGDISYVKADGESHGFEKVFSVNADEGRISEMVDLMKSGVMPESVFVMPYSKPHNLAEMLADMGLKVEENAGYAIKYLSDHKEAPAIPVDFEVSLVTDKNQLAHWQKLINQESFDGEEVLQLERLDTLLGRGGISLYLAEIRGKAVGACTIVHDGETSYLGLMDTLEPPKDVDYGDPLLHHVFLDLKDKGIKTISSTSVGWLIKLGFNEVCKRKIASLACWQEVNLITKGIELSWFSWGKMRGHNLILGDISYVKAEKSGFERIFSVNIDEANQDSRISEMVDLMKSGVMPESMLIMPSTKPSNLAEVLKGKGYHINDNDPCMLMYLDGYKNIPYTPDNFEMCIVTDKKQLVQWLDIVNKGFFEGEIVTTEQLGDLLGLDSTAFYLGLVDGKPVVSCIIIDDGETSCLEMVVTLNEYRKKGYATTLINKALMDLKGKGVKSISLRAEADGVGIYTKLGFKEVCKRIVASL